MALVYFSSYHPDRSQAGKSALSLCVEKKKPQNHTTESVKKKKDVINSCIFVAFTPVLNGRIC